MQKNTLWLFVVLLVMYLALVYCDDKVNVTAHSFGSKDAVIQSTSRALIFPEEGRTRRRPGLQHQFWGWHALAIAYWIKVKLVIIGFFVGSAIFVGLRYVWPNKCTSSVVHDSPIIYDHPPSYHNDHIPYSFDHSSSFGPYSAYSPSSFSDVGDSVSGPSAHEIKRRSVGDKARQRQRPPVATEEQIAEIMFYFLGLDTKACRRRFICEMEFRSRLHPLTSMAFRIVGRGFFEKYTNARNELGQAKSFGECAVVNSECVFIEQNEETEQAVQEPEIVENSEVEKEESGNREQHENAESSAENEVNVKGAHEMEQQNAANLRAERRLVKLRRRGDRKLDPLAQHILAQVREQ